jgi:OOP family OmpA-OmpF porin
MAAARSSMRSAPPPQHKWSLLGRIGVAHVNLDTSAGDDSGSGPKVGLGAQYNLTSNLAVRGEWERYRSKLFDGHPNLDQYTVGVRFAF